MDTRVAAWVLLLLLSALVTEGQEEDALAPKWKLCGWDFVRALIHACQPYRFGRDRKGGLRALNRTRLSSEAPPPPFAKTLDEVPTQSNDEELASALVYLPPELSVWPFFNPLTCCMSMCSLWDLETLCE